MKNILFTGLAAGSLMFTSCGDKKGDAVATGIEKSGLKATEAVESWKNDLTNGQIASLWDSLPAGYQTDVTGVVHSFGEKVDPDVYSEAMKTVTAASKFLKEKKGIIVEVVKGQAPASELDKVEQIEASYDSVVGLLHMIATSDAKDVDGLKKLDVVSFLTEIQEHSKELVAYLSSITGDNDKLEKFKAVTATLISETADTAEVEVAHEGDKKQVKLVKIEDRWLPEQMSNEWSGNISKANEAIDKLATLKPVQKEQYLAVLRMVQASITELEGANTKEELQAKMGAVMGQFMGM